MKTEKECKFNFYTCSNLNKYLHSKEFCDECIEGDNYQCIDDFSTVIKTIKTKNKTTNKN